VNVAEFTTLFDQYRINYVVLKFMCGTLETNSTDNATMTIACDYDDGNAPTNVSDLFQYDNCKIYSYGKDINVKLKPRIAMAAYGGAFTSYANAGGMWLDVASPAVEYYGVKACLTRCNAQCTYRIYATYYIELKSTR
jgi:hypothetical protein